MLQMCWDEETYKIGWYFEGIALYKGTRTMVALLKLCVAACVETSLVSIFIICFLDIIAANFRIDFISTISHTHTLPTLELR